VRTAILEAVSELIEELDGIQQQISDQALEHVHSNEVILTFGYCRTVHLFLREAAKKRQFQVVVAEGAPSYEGQKLARDLASDGIHTTCITDSAVFAMMARANMVVIGAHAVLANGGMLGMVRATTRAHAHHR
jgi:translation initiation factor eIF-2B subunit beta